MPDHVQCWRCGEQQPSDARMCAACDRKGQATRVRIADYIVADAIGAGAFGEVYRCRDPQSGDTVAVKVLKITTLEGRALVELEAPALIDHPGVVRVLASLPAENAFVMEFIDGPTLQQLMAREPDRVQEAFVPWATDLLSALGAAHRHQILHRDIKPANVLMEAVERPKLADFGVARVLGDSGVARTRAGTPLYMAPEIHRGEDYDAAADIYSLGILFYEIWAGQPPFQASSEPGLALAKLQGKHERADSVNPETPAWIAEMIDRMLAVEPSRPSAEQLLTELLTQRWIQGGRELASIDAFAFAVGAIYSAKNSARGPLILLAHYLAELEGVVGGMRDGDRAYGRSRTIESLPKAFAWLTALATSLNFRLSQVIDLKFPGHCPYCEASPCECSDQESRLVKNRELRDKVRTSHPVLPDGSAKSFAEYQEMFKTIYHDRNRSAGIDAVGVDALAAVAQFTDAFLRLRSLKELDAVEIVPLELADLLAWFMALVNLANEDGPVDLQRDFEAMYPGTCPKCGNEVCTCPDLEHELRLINWRDFK